MNLFNILQEIEQVDREFHKRPTVRRQAMQQFVSLGRKLTLATLPLALGSIIKPAYGQNSTAAVEDVLQFALTLEYLQAEFYTAAIAAPALIPTGSDLTAITTIRDHQNQHVNFLKTLLESLDFSPATKPTFDFTGGKGSGTGPFGDVFSNYDTFLAMAQTFEDTGVRAYKGQTPRLAGGKEVLRAALNIHSVEARHAAHIRQMRMARGAMVKPWVTGSESGIGTAVESSYKGEDNDTQGGIKITGIKDPQISLTVATEAFDEPLTTEEVLAILGPFLVS